MTRLFLIFYIATFTALNFMMLWQLKVDIEQVKTQQYFQKLALEQMIGKTR